jgi:hypothetical protein
VKAETKFLRDLRQRGYFAKEGFDPQPVFDAAKKHLGIDATTVEENERLTTVINRLVREGVIRFEYSQDPSRHPKDVPDHWRIVLAPAGVALLEKEPSQPPPPIPQARDWLSLNVGPRNPEMALSTRKTSGEAEWRSAEAVKGIVAFTGVSSWCLQSLGYVLPPGEDLIPWAAIVRFTCGVVLAVIGTAICLFIIPKRNKTEERWLRWCARLNYSAFALAVGVPLVFTLFTVVFKRH